MTLVSPDGNYQVKDLAEQGDPDAPFPLADFPAGPGAGPERFAALAFDYERCFADGDAIRNCHVRPNEVYLGPANRTDLFFQAPALDGADIADYSVIALGVILHADTPLQGMQQNAQAPFQRDLEGTASKAKVNPPDGPGDVVVAWLRVTGGACPTFDMASIAEVLPEVPAYLRPIGDDEPGLRTPDGSGFRTRRLVYSGWGANALPLVSAQVGGGDDDEVNRTPTSRAFAEFIRADQRKPVAERLEGLRYARRRADAGQPATYVLLAPSQRTMAIDGRKFDPTDADRPRMFLGSAEEWVVYNSSDFLWADTDEKSLPATQYGTHYEAAPATLAEGMEQFRGHRGFQVVSRAVDHPFHMHQNPFWVTRIDVPAADGELHNILDEPRWMDVVPVPRHRGRVVFRSRFPDFVGTYVNHCHILLHEDNGMMQPVEVTPFDRRPPGDVADDTDVARANYEPRSSLATGGPSAEATASVTELYPRPSLAEGYRQNMSFIDRNPTTGQTYPGFEVDPPA